MGFSFIFPTRERSNGEVGLAGSKEKVDWFLRFHKRSKPWTKASKSLQNTKEQAIFVYVHLTTEQLSWGVQGLLLQDEQKPLPADKSCGPGGKSLGYASLQPRLNTIMTRATETVQPPTLCLIVLLFPLPPIIYSVLYFTAHQRTNRVIGWIWVPLEFIYWNLIPKVREFGSEVLGKWLGHEGGAPVNGISAPETPGNSLTPSTVCSYREKSAISEPERGPLPSTKSKDTLN